MSGSDDPTWTLMVSLLSGLIGSVIGALITVFLTWLHEWVRRPQLSLLFSSFEKGLIVDTPVVEGPKCGRLRGLRVLVRNDGSTTAHKVTVSMLKFDYAPDNKDQQPASLRDEVLDLNLSITGLHQFDLPPKNHRWVNVCSAVQYETEDPFIVFGFAHGELLRLRLMGFGRPGLYSALIEAVAHNAEPSRQTLIKWRWDGTANGLSMVHPG